MMTGTTEGEWVNPGIYFDPLEGDILPGEPVIKHTGNRLQVAVPVTDEWGDKPATLAGKRCRLSSPTAIKPSKRN